MSDHASAPAEGVIRFRLAHRPGPPAGAAQTRPLQAWFGILRPLELLGRDPDRYDGHAYGNLSRRTEDGFLVTCTQTGGLSELAPRHFARVTGWNLEENLLEATGPCPPSSEALTHAVVYETIPGCGFVFHVHAPLPWRRARQLGLPVTDPGAEYGTPEMARATRAVLDRLGRPALGALSMGGHEDGILAWGPEADDAGCLLVQLLARAME